MIRITVDGVPTLKHKLEGKTLLAADKDTMYMAFGTTDQDQILKLKIDSDMKRSLDLSIAPFYQLTSMQKPEKLTAQILKGLENMIVLKRNQMNMAKQAAEKSSKSANPKEKAAATAAMPQIENEIRNLDQAGLQAGQLKSVVEDLSNNGKLHLEVFYKADEEELMLATTNPPAKPKAAAPAKK